MRPFGGMIIGYMGDKYGRKYALVLSLFLMAIPTFVMGCLPTYSQVGVQSYWLFADYYKECLLVVSYQHR